MASKLLRDDTSTPIQIFTPTKSYAPTTLASLEELVFAADAAADYNTSGVKMLHFFVTEPVVRYFNGDSGNVFPIVEEAYLALTPGSTITIVNNGGSASTIYVEGM